VNVLSLFSGIGGLDLGLERAGMTVVGQVEIDPFCQRVLAKHWPKVPRHDDVRTCVEWWLGEPRPAVDVICGGFPCQPVSVAGKQRAQQDERWLWPAFAAVIRDLRPRYAIMENVPGLLARGMGDVLADLAEIGYDAEWDCVPAVAVGANHRRDRVFILAHPQRAGVRLEPVPEQRRRGATVVDADGPTRLVADSDCATRGREAWPAEPGTGFGSVRQRPEEPGRRDSDVANPDGNGRPERTNLPSAAGRDDRADAAGCGSLVAHAHGSRREPWAWMGGPWPAPVRDGWWATEPDVGRVAHGVPGRVDRLRGLGNAVVPQVAEHIGRLVMEAAHAVA
jgi:DNA (cytosine-5)-methyltransferase 1